MQTLTVREGRFRIKLTADFKRLREVRLGLNGKGLNRPGLFVSYALLRKSERMLHHYFQKGKPLGKIPLNWEQQSPFEKRVLRCVRKIPFGEVRSYGWLAREIGMPKGARSCGQALKRNRFVLFIPCHRIVGNSSVGGFSCGVRLKEKLLAHEQAFLTRKTE